MPFRFRNRAEGSTEEVIFLFRGSAIRCRIAGKKGVELFGVLIRRRREDFPVFPENRSDSRAFGVRENGGTVILLSAE